MGQYYKILNVDKKEYIKPWDFDCGAKLLEWGYLVNRHSSNGFVSAFRKLLSTRWKGDRVYVVGDYATPYDSHCVSEYETILKAVEQLFNSTDSNNVSAVIYGQEVDSINDARAVIESLKRESCDTDWKDVLAGLYGEIDWLGKIATSEDDCYTEGYPILLYAAKGFTNVLDIIDKNELTGYIAPRYICNSETREYIDTMSLPVEWILYDADEDIEDYYEDDVTDLPSVSLDPLALLLAMCNGKGGGDYRDLPNENLLGTWCRHSKGVFFTDFIPSGYELFVPGFREYAKDIETVA